MNLGYKRVAGRVRIEEGEIRKLDHYSSWLGHCGKKRGGGEKHQDQTAQVTTSHENSPPLKMYAFFGLLSFFDGKAL